MRILYYIPSLYSSGGLERIISYKANYLADKFGYEVMVLTSEQQGKSHYFKLSENVHSVDIDVVFDGGSRQKSKITRLLEYPLKYRLFKKRFIEVISDFNPDITISTLRRELYFITSLRYGGVKIGEFHVTRHSYHGGAIRGKGLLHNLLKRLLGKFLVYKMGKLSTIVLLTKEEVLNWPELNNTVIIYNPLTFTTERYSDCTSHEVIAVGRYSYQKGFDLLVDVWRIVHDKHPDWILNIYGEGERESLMRQISNYHLDNNCLLKLPVNNISDKYADSSIFVLSSRFEGFGMVICEAMVCGVPPVSFACPCGPRDIITDGSDGLLVDNGNIEEMAQKICYLIENETLRKQMGNNARISAERFDAENIMGQWKDLFEKLCDKE